MTYNFLKKTHRRTVDFEFFKISLFLNIRFIDQMFYHGMFKNVKICIYHVFTGFACYDVVHLRHLCIFVFLLTYSKHIAYCIKRKIFNHQETKFCGFIIVD